MPDELVPLDEDAFVTETSDEECIILFGFLQINGDKVKAYTDQNLSAYIEFDHKDIKYAQKAPPSVSPLGGSYVWLSKDAKCVYSHRNVSMTDELGLIKGKIVTHIMSMVQSGKPRWPEGGNMQELPGGSTPICCEVPAGGPGNASLPGPGNTDIANPFVPTICGFTCYPPCLSTPVCTPDNFGRPPIGIPGIGDPWEGLL